MISVNRALSELKLVTKKIEQKTVDLETAVAVSVNVSDEVKKAFIDKSTASVQQIKDLIERRASLKAAIVSSNAATSVSISDVTMTVAEAIERKSSIDLNRNLCKKLREGYFHIKVSVDNHNNKVNNEADKQASAALGADTEGDKGAAYKAIVTSYKEANNAEVLAPTGIEGDIELMQDAIDEFESEVDFVLSESNIKTMIEV